LRHNIQALGVLPVHYIVVSLSQRALVNHNTAAQVISMWPLQGQPYSQQVDWLTNFVFKCNAALLTTLGFNAADIAAIPGELVALTNAASLSLQNSDLLRNDSSELVALKRRVFDGDAPPNPQADPAAVIPFTVTVASGSITGYGVVPYINNLVARIKASPAFTEAIGADLDCLPGSGNSPPTKPLLLGTPQPVGQVRITFSLYSYDGLEIQSRRGAEAIWSQFAVAVTSPYIDTRPLLVAGQPEMRHYRAMYMQGNAPVGELSDELVVVAAP
jgi:hypothetical protein